MEENSIKSTCLSSYSVEIDDGEEEEEDGLKKMMFLNGPIRGNEKEDVTYVDEIMSLRDEKELLLHIDSREWIQLKRRRLQQYGGTPGKSTKRLPAFLRYASRKLVEMGLFPKEYPPNHVLINEYEKGQGIMSHKDGPLYYSNVVILSLLGSCRFDFHNKVPRRDDEPHSSLLVLPRSLLKFQRSKYKDYWHGIKASTCDIIKSHTSNRGDHALGHIIPRGSRRVSLTFRHVFQLKKKKKKKRRGRLRWAVNVSEFDPVEKENSKDFLSLLSMCSERKDERDKVLRYRRWEDKKRALFSRLLTRAACVSTFPGRKRDEIVIKRTKGGKPFLSTSSSLKSSDDEIPNFNFNVAHDGDFVILCSEPVLLCGVDVCGRQGPKDRTSLRSVSEWFELFEDHFDSEEWKWIRHADKPEEQLSVFRLLWSCKEAFTKARGDGLACRLRRCTFRREEEDDYEKKSLYRLKLYFDNIERSDWDFVSILFAGDHWITVARTSPSKAIDANGEFKCTFRLPGVGLGDDDDDDDDDAGGRGERGPNVIDFDILKAKDLRSILLLLQN